MKINNLIPKRNFHCVLGKEPFKDGDSYVSHLLENDTSFERKDYCVSCWEREEKPVGHVWRGKIPLKMQRDFSSLQKALKFFYKLSENKEDPKLLYVLTQLLLRKKALFKLKNEHYECAATGEVFHIKTFILKAEETEALSLQITQLFHG